MTLEPAPSAAELPDYENLPRPFWRLAVLMLIAPVAAVVFVQDWPTQLASLTRHFPVGVALFLTNLYVFACFWLVYFASGWTDPFSKSRWSRLTKSQTLRVLLKVHSHQWKSPENKGEASERVTEAIAARREKAKTTMTAQAIFIGITATITFATVNILLQNDALEPSTGMRFLDKGIAMATLAAAMTAFTLLLVAADAAETMFNTFAPDREEVAISSLYLISARLKYYGFVLCFSSLVAFVYVISPAISAIIFYFIMFVGYNYWFRDASDSKKHRWERWVFVVMLAAIDGYVGYHAL